MQTPEQRKIMSCPLNGQICCNGIRDDFKEDPVTKQKFVCRFWMHVAGQGPNKEQVDYFDCSIAWVPMLLVENSQRIHQNSATLDKVANEVKGLRQTPIMIQLPSPKQRAAELEVIPGTNGTKPD